MKEIETNSEAAAENPKSATNGAAKLLFDVNEAAARLNVSVVSCRKLLRQGRLKRIANFRKILIPESSMQEFAATVE
jgi:excisionase family DNA binding protein